MPHDQIGFEIKDGDVVSLTAIVRNVSAGEKNCNCTFEVQVPLGVDETYGPSFAGNTRLATLKVPGPAVPSENLHPAVRSVLQFFAFKHLPPHLQVVSAPFCELAEQVARGPGNAETTVALRKLLEAKDAAVRAVVGQF